MSAPASSIGSFWPDAGEPQAPADVAVAIPTVLRPVLGRAVESVFAQAGAGRVQLVIGIDKPGPFAAELDTLLGRRPANVSALVIALPFSTSMRNGGVHPAMDGGALRSIMSFAANARHVAYLDDDNWWRADHLRRLLAAARGKVWAYSQRVLVREDTGEELGVDRWDSVGPGAGRFAAQGGFVDPSCLLVDKVAAARALGRWTENGRGVPGTDNDRFFFAAIRDAPHGRVEEATAYYSVRPTNVLLRFMAEGREF